MRSMRMACLLFVLPLGASAQTLVPGLRDLSGTRALGMGNAYRAMGSGNEALFLNPAALAGYSRYELDVFGLFETPYDHHAVQVSLVDSNAAADPEVPLVGGVAYTNFAAGTESDRRGGSVVTLGLALRARFARHARLARWTLPTWFYVSVTGVVIYVMLYGV